MRYRTSPARGGPDTSRPGTCRTRGANNRVRTLIITFFGTGFLPVASGTWGSAGAVLAFLPLWWLAGQDGWRDPVLLGMAVAACILSVALGPWSVARFGAEDPKEFVLDEVAGQWVALLWLPMADPQAMAMVVACQFILFRVFDIIKPPPARQLERLPFGWGILLDDVMAGLYANLLGQVLFRWILV